MTATDLYARVLRPAECIILRRRLRPLTLGHMALLEQADCVIPKSIGELLTAIEICSHTHTRAARMLESPSQLRLLVWKLMLGSEWDFPAALGVWCDYVRYHTEMPEAIWSGDRSVSAKKSGVPFHQHLRVVLMHDLHYPPETVDQTPYLRAMWDYYSLGEYLGRLRVTRRSQYDADDEYAASVSASDDEVMELIRACRR